MPLTGGMEVIDIGCEGSKLTAGYHDEMTNRSVFGTLSTLDGHPVPDQWVYIYKCSDTLCDLYFDYPVKTCYDGSFLAIKDIRYGMWIGRIEVQFGGNNGYVKRVGPPALTGWRPSIRTPALMGRPSPDVPDGARPRSTTQPGCIIDRETGGSMPMSGIRPAARPHSVRGRFTACAARTGDPGNQTAYSVAPAVLSPRYAVTMRQTSSASRMIAPAAVLSQVSL